MTRDAVKNLSRMIRDKDLEIESLNQKNQTLLQVLQESSSAGSQVAGLTAERDNLTKQLAIWQADREQIIAALNQKHQESVSFHTELQRVTALCSQHSEELEKMKQQYQKLSQQYEDKQQQLVKAQNELVNYKHKYQESDNRYQELLQQGGANPNRTEQTSKEIEQLTGELRILKENMAHLEQNLKDKSEALLSSNQLLKEKDENLSELSGKFRQMEESIYGKDSELGSLRKQAENTQFQMSGLRTEIGDLQQERDEFSQQNRALQSEIHILKDSHQKLSMFLGEKDFEINALKEKANTLAKLVAEKGGDEKGEMDRMMRESEAMQGQAQAFQQERDQALMALQQSQADGFQLRDQLSKLSERERKLGRELERLRNHLLAIEEGYTQEALGAEEREKELRNRLAAAEERASSSSSAVKNASEQASAQVESLQRQLQALAEQRDAAVLQLASAQDTANQYAASLNNLQMVLEQFQQERETQIAVELERYQKKLEHTKTENGALQEKCNILQTQLEESQETIEAAHRLSEQLDRKEEAVMALKEEVLLREKQLLKVEEELNKMTSSNEAKVDKVVIKNLFLGYFHTPTNKRREVLQLIGKVLNFSQEEMAQASSESSQSRGWLGLGGLLKRTPPHPTSSPPTTPHRTSIDKSFSELFVKFLEKESSPIPSLNVKLPAEAMAREKQVQNEQHHQQRQKPVFNPFSAPRHATMPIQVGGVKPDDSHLLMKPMASTLPTFTPLITPELTTPAAPSGDGSGRSSVASSGRSTPATTSAILRDVLQQ
jgi:chromosome segregation ATPase